MITPGEARRILGPSAEGLKDEELLRLLDNLYDFAGIVVEGFSAKRTEMKN